MSFKIGDKVKFIEDWDIFPFDYINKGETGSIAVNDDEMISVKLDKYHEDLETWDNEAHIYKEDDERKAEDYICKIGDDVK